MGWTFQEARYNINGKIDRKAECDSIMNDDCFRVEKSALIGSTYYAAVTRIAKYIDGKPIPLPENERYTFAVVCLTSIRSNDWCNFGYKDMSEDCGPFYYDCPKSILKLLSPTTNECALKWRSACVEKAEKKKNPNALGNLPIGAIIQLSDGTKLIKRAPAYQFKTPWWYNAEKNCYKKKNHIGEYTVISA